MPRRNIQLPIDELVARYAAGESTCVLARAFGVGSDTVLERLRSAGAVIRFRGRKRLPLREMAERYRAGESTADLARAYGINRTTSRKRLVGAGVAMRPEGSWAPGGPLWVERSGHLRTYDRAHRHCSIHRGCWEAYHGPIPKEHAIHHVNGNPLDNHIDNLACMTRGEHSRLHKTRTRKEATDDSAL